MNYADGYKFGTQVSIVFLKSILPKLKGKKIADFGCGTGEYLKYFDVGSQGFDYSPKNIEEGTKNKLIISQIDLNNPDVNLPHFDAVFLSQVLEHVESPIKLLRYINQRLHIGGIAVISVPNEHSFIHKVYPYFTRDGNHLYSFTSDNLTELLEFSGFRVKEIYYDYYSSFIMKYHLDTIVKYLDWLPTSIKTPFAWSYWMVVEKVKDETR